MTKIDNIRRWLKEIDTDIDPFTVSSHGLHLGTLEYPIDRYKLSDLSLDVSMPPLIINEARIIGERKLHLILPNLSETQIVFMSKPIPGRRLQTGAWLRDVSTANSSISYEIATTTIDDIGTEICYQTYRFSTYEQKEQPIINTSELDLDKYDEWEGLEQELIYAQTVLGAVKNDDIIPNLLRIYCYSKMGSIYQLDFQVGGTQSTTFYYSQSESLVPHLIGNTTRQIATHPKHKYIHRTFVFNKYENVLMDTETIVQTPSPMREGGYHAIPGN